MRGMIHHIEMNVANLEKSRQFWLPFLTALTMRFIKNGRPAFQ